MSFFFLQVPGATQVPTDEQLLTEEQSGIEQLAPIQPIRQEHVLLAIQSPRELQLFNESQFTLVAKEIENLLTLDFLQSIF